MIGDNNTMNGLVDKTVALVGPFGQLTHNLTARLAEYGANVCLATNNFAAADRICQNISDMREVSEKYGRTAAIETNFNSEKEIRNLFSRSAELFGGIDIYIDAQLFGLEIPFYTQKKVVDFEKSFKTFFENLKCATEVAAAYLKSRSKGKILYLYHELDMLAAEKSDSKVFVEFINYVKQKAIELSTQNTAVNSLAVGVNEEYLLTRFSKSLTIQQSLKELAKEIPHARLVDYNEITNYASFMVSPMSSGLSGQTIRLDHGL